MTSDVLEKTLADLADDLGELVYLAGSGGHKLAAYRAQMNRHPDAYHPATADLVSEQVARLGKAYDDLRAELEARLAARAGWSADDIPHLTELKRRGYHLVKALHLLGGSIATAAEWQSPSFLHTVMSQAGKHTGAVTGTINDYQRDHHRDAKAYEVAFRDAYIDADRMPSAVACSSGMSAFTTVVGALHLEKKLEGAIVVGKSTYFECKEVLEDFCRGRVTYVDEMDFDAVIDAVRKLQPSAIFLDSLCNVEAITVPDLPRLIPALGKAIRKPATLVIDNAGLGPTYQPLASQPVSDLGVIVLESLNKYHQFGFDGVTGGMVWRDFGVQLNLFRARMHLGTNIPDASVLALPSPNREMLLTRMARLHRNATYLATTLDAHLAARKHLLLSHVAYPGLPSHPAYAWMKDRPFHGSFLTLAFRTLARIPAVYQAWLRLAIAEAKKDAIDLNAGTSFGFNTSRVYLTARHANRSTTPFIRISAGTETQHEIEALAAALIRATDKMTL